MNLAKLVSLFAALLISTVACAEDPNPVVPKDGHSEEEEHTELRAVSFTGQLLERNPLTNKLEIPKNPKSCTLQLSMMEEEEDEHGHEDGGHGHGEEHEHHMIAQIAEKSPHGESIPAMEIEPYFLDMDAGKYVKEAPQSGDYIPALVGVTVEEKAGEADINKLPQYIKDLTLIQSFQFNFKTDVNFEALMEALEETLESDEKNLSVSSMKAFSQMEYMTVKQRHLTHVDDMFCTNFKLDSQVSEVEFEFEHEHGHEH